MKRQQLYVVVIIFAVVCIFIKNKILTSSNVDNWKQVTIPLSVDTKKLIESANPHVDIGHEQNFLRHPESTSSKQPHRADAQLFSTSEGGLGNLMFQFASAYSIAKHHRRQLIVDERTSRFLQRVFKMHTKAIPQPFRVNTSEINFKEIGKNNNTIEHNFYADDHNFKPYLLSDIPDEDVMILDFLGSWKYFKHDEVDIRSLFRLQEDIAKNSAAVIEETLTKFGYSKNKNITLVGIHVRRGDIEGQQTLAPASYFKKAQDYFRQKYENAFFIATTNDFEWTNHTFWGQVDTFVVQTSWVSDFAILMSCDHVIMSVGSYGWWAGWLAHGDVVYFNDLRRSGRLHFPVGDYFLPHWIPISYDSTVGELE